MNKMLKGTIAIVAAVLLLVGGGGTLAVWNVKAPVWGASAAVNAGSMKLSTVSGSWTDQHGTVIPDITAYRVVPGDTLTYQQTLKASLVGNNLSAKLSVSQAAYPIFYRDGVQVTTAVLNNQTSATSVNFLNSTGPNEMILTGSQAGMDYTVAGSLVLHFTDNMPADVTVLDLAAINFELSQVL